MALTLADYRLWLGLLLAAGALAGIAWAVRLRWKPAYALRLALLAALLPLLIPAVELAQTPTLPGREVLVVDESSSMGTTLAANRKLAKTWAAEQANRLVVVFGAQAQAVTDPEGKWPVVDSRSTNLEAALETAGHLLEGSPGRVILVSDGRVRDEEAVTRAAAKLSAAGRRLDVLPLEQAADRNDLAVEGVSAPGSLWSGLPFEITVRLRSGRAGTVRLQVQADGQPAAATQVQVPEGASSAAVSLRAGGAGITTLAVQARMEGDPRPENNSGYAAARVYPAPAALFVTEEAEKATRFVLMLNGSGVQVNLAGPGQLPTAMDALRAYQVIVLDNLLVDSLNGEQLAALRIFVSELGRGLVILGGRSAYTLGGYDNSVLEAMLPVKMQPPERQKRAPVTFVLMVDVSASMGYSTQADQPRPIDLAREASMRVIESMQPDDTLGIASYSDDLSWDLPLSRVGDGLNLRLATDTASRLQPLFGTQMYKAMLQVIKTMGAGDGQQKRYLLLLSDGRSADGSLLEFTNLTKVAAENGVTVSTIALGEEPDRQVMAAIAREGHGRYYEVPDVRMLPRAMVNETRAAKSENVQEGETGVKAESAHPVLAGVDLSSFPALSGYNALRSRKDEGAEDILVSASYGDPLLSAWQVGLGRVAAWMGDAGEEWAAGMPEWKDAGRLWSQVLRYTLPAPGIEMSGAAVEVEDTRVVISAALRAENGTAVSFAKPVVQVAEADGQVRAFAMTETGAGTYRAELPRPQPGAYRAVVQWQQDGATREMPLPLAVNPGFEDLPGKEGAGPAAMRVWAQAGGGQVLERGSLGAGSTSAPAAGLAPKAGLGWLVPAVLMGWVLEIAARRRWLPWR